VASAGLKKIQTHSRSTFSICAGIITDQNSGVWSRPGCVKDHVQHLNSRLPNLAKFEIRDTSVNCQALSAYPMIFRSKGSSTQGVVDRVFRHAGVKPIPLLVLDTRDGVYEAVANGLGIGFMWHNGTSRTDRTRKIRVSELLRTHPEHIVHLADNDNALVHAFSSITL